jgi:sialate O-acetylesterase
MISGFTMSHRHVKLITFLIVTFLTLGLEAAPKLPGFFTDHMVLQRDKPIQVWGWADAKENIKLSFGGKTLKVKADLDGHWKATFPAMQANTQAQELKVIGSKASKGIILKNILVGDVWICSGQSNMEWDVRSSMNAEEEMKASDHPLIRHIKIHHTTADLPRDDVQSHWKVSNPKDIAQFTAVGYYFARKLKNELNVPIGLIGANWGGMRIEPFIAPEGFRMIPELKDIAERVDRTLPISAEGKKAHAEYLAQIEAWLPKIRKALKNGKHYPELPIQPQVGNSSQDPSRIFNAMIHPLIPFTIRGVIWYQGESNGGESMSYYHKKHALVKGWRQLWNQGDFPFYWVQLSAFTPYSDHPAGANNWTRLREAQVKALDLPNSGMVVTTDIGNHQDIHPRNKQDVGKRLALCALAKEYGKDVVYSGPHYKGHKVEGNTIRLLFDHIGGGLMVGKKKFRSTDPVEEIPNGTLGHFAISGEDQQWHWATAKIDGDDVVVSSDKVSKPIAVRYAFQSNPEGANLYNRAGLPATPFRTDTWHR